jgi:glycosyltransferase involved in cell wall biosynthesis
VSTWPGQDPRVSVVIPAHNEGQGIVPVLNRMLESVTLPCEIIVVVDTPDDTTVPAVEGFSDGTPAVRVVVNDYGPGPAQAIRYGIHHSKAPVVVVTMADGCDDPRQIDELTRLVERGVVVAAASRYMPGGQQVGGPLVKRAMSATAGRTLYWFARVGTRDATNSFKAYQREFVQRVDIDSRDGFEIGLELTAKARRMRLPVAEIPTIWLDRPAGESSFKVLKWLPRYLQWYRFAYGPRLDDEQLRGRARHGRRGEE